MWPWCWHHSLVYLNNYLRSCQTVFKNRWTTCIPTGMREQYGFSTFSLALGAARFWGVCCFYSYSNMCAVAGILNTLENHTHECKFLSSHRESEVQITLSSIPARQQLVITSAAFTPTHFSPCITAANTPSCQLHTYKCVIWTVTEFENHL